VHMRGGLLSGPVWWVDVPNDYDEYEMYGEDGAGAQQEAGLVEQTEMRAAHGVDTLMDTPMVDVSPVQSLEGVIQHGSAVVTTASRLPNPATIMAALPDSYDALGSWDAFFAYQEAFGARMAAAVGSKRERHRGAAGQFHAGMGDQEQGGFAIRTENGMDPDHRIWR